MARRLNNCCCFSVRTGTLILATLGIIGGIWSVVQNGAYAATSNIQEEQINKQEEMLKIKYEQGQITKENYELTLQMLEVAKSALLPILIFGLFQAIISLVISSLLLFGSLYRKHTLMLPYIVLQGIGIVLAALVCIIAFVVMIFAVGFVAAIFYGLFMFAILFVLYYLLLVVYSHYRDIKEENEQNQVAPGFKSLA